MKSTEDKHLKDFIYEAMKSAAKKFFGRELKQIQNDMYSLDLDVIIYSCQKVYTVRMCMEAMGISRKAVYAFKRNIETSEINRVLDLCDEVCQYLSTEYNPQMNGFLIRRVKVSDKDYNYGSETIKVAMMLRRAIKSIPLELSGLQSQDQIMMKTRKKNICRPRQLIQHILTRDRDFSTVCVALAFDVDHSTVIHSRDTVTSERDIYNPPRIDFIHKEVLKFVKESIKEQVKNEAISRQQHAE